MFEILTTSEMQQADALTIESGVDGFSLMTAAGVSVAQIIKAQIKPCPVLVLCGPGNNGGDGFIIAQFLQKSGFDVRLACLVRKKELKGDAAKASALWEDDIESLNSNLSLKNIQLVVDAIFGTGFSKGLPPELEALFDKIRTKRIPVVAVDIPSGIDGTTGSIAESTLKPVTTVTFCRKKLAHVLLPSKVMCGRVHVADIGITDETVTSLNVKVFENNPGLWLKDFPLPDADTHKYHRGHVCILGGKKRTGAACLSAHAAQKIGAGLVTIAAPEKAATVYQSYRASIMVDTWESREDLKSILRDEKKNVLILGPGAGTGPKTHSRIETALSFGKKAVLDADVFTLFKEDPSHLFKHLNDQCVLTPHEGEFARFFPDVHGNKLERAQKAALLSGAIVLLKGADTVIAAPDGTTIINTNAPATLATGGSGDVLTGIIAGLMAQNMPSFMAAAASCWLHAQTAQIYGLGLTAEDIISHINQMLGHLFDPHPKNT